MGQADAAPKTPRYDPYLRHACAERTLKLHDRNYGYRIVLNGGVVFVSEPIAEADEFSSLFFRRLEVKTNKRNFEYRLMNKCQAAVISNSHATTPQSCISYVGRRQLLLPDRRTVLNFEAGRATSKPMQPGSRLVAVVSVLGRLCSLGWPRRSIATASARRVPKGCK